MSEEKAKRGRRLGSKTTELTRSKIQTSLIINRLTKHILGTLKNDVTKEPVEMSASQVTAAGILLKKVIPDLSATNIQGDIFNYHYIATDKPMDEDDWAAQYEDSLGTSEGPSKSIN